MFEFYQHGLL